MYYTWWSERVVTHTVYNFLFQSFCGQISSHEHYQNAHQFEDAAWTAFATINKAQLHKYRTGHGA